MTTWRCLTCDLHGTGPWAPVDTSAARHNEQTKHPTETRTVGSRRTRDENGRVRNVAGMETES